MKELIKKKRALKILKDSSANKSFLLHDGMVRDAQHLRSRRKRDKKDCGLVVIPEALAEQCKRNNLFFLTWNVWFRLVLKLKDELKKHTSSQTRQTNGDIVFSLFYGKNESFPKKFGRCGFVFEIHQDWAAKVLNEQFGLPRKMIFSHPCPLQMYERIICGYNLLKK